MAETTIDVTTQGRHRVLVATGVGHFVEWFDFAIYGLSATLLADLFFPSDSRTAGVLSVFALFAVSFAMRPLGGLFFGVLADRLGRRTVLIATVTMMGVATAGIGVLPTTHQVGLLATGLLVVCRLVQGFSAGGEAPSAISFILEHTDKSRRATWISVVIAMSVLPSLVASVLFFALSELLEPTAYESWGWRIPFLLALPLSLIGLYIRMGTMESPVFTGMRDRGEASSTPLRDSLSKHKMKMFNVLVVIGLSALGFYFLVSYLVSYLELNADFSREASLLTTAATLTVFAVALPVGGRISDSVGRRPVLLAGSGAVALAAVPSLYIAGHASTLVAFIGPTVLAVALALYGGASYTFFAELFPPETRATGAGISYNVAYAAFGGTGPLVGTYLVDSTGNNLAPGYYVAGIAAVVFLITWLTIRETR